MPDLVLETKREAIAQGYALWVQSVTGSRPGIDRVSNGRNISLTQSQIAAMSENIRESMTAKSHPTDLNVSMPWGKILLPAMSKIYWPYAIGAVILIGGTGYLLGRK